MSFSHVLDKMVIEILPDGFYTSVANFWVFGASIFYGKFITNKKNVLKKDIHVFKASIALVACIGFYVLIKQLMKLLLAQTVSSLFGFSDWFVWMTFVGVSLGLTFAFSSIFALRPVWEYKPLSDDDFWGIDEKIVHRGQRRTLWAFGIVVIVLTFWSIWVALRPCNGLDRILERSGCMEQIRDIGERRLGLATVSQDGKWLAYTVQGPGFTPEQITLWNLEEHRLAWVANLPDESGFLSGSPEYSPDGNLLALLSPPYYDESGLTTNLWRVADGQFVETITRSKLPRELALTPSGESTFTLNFSAQQLWDWILRNPVILQGPNFEMTVQHVGSGSDRWYIMGKVADNWQTWQVENGLLSQVDEIESNESDMFEQIRQTLPTEYDDYNLFLPAGKDYYILRTNRAFQLWRLPSPQP